VISSRSARVSIGPLRNGESFLVHLIFYNPIVVPSRALSKAPPIVPGNDPEPHRKRKVRYLLSPQRFDVLFYQTLDVLLIPG
jgi:hypothetical protein